MDNPAPDAPEHIVVVRRRRWGRWIALAFAGLVALAGALVGLIDTQIGHRFIVDRIVALRPSSGLRFSVGRIDGSIYHSARLIDVRVYDPKGLVFSAPLIQLDWHPFAWLNNRLDIDRVEVPTALLAKLPQTIASGKPSGSILPGFDIHVGRLAIGRLTVGPAIVGTAREGTLSAEADIREGRAKLAMEGRVDGTDQLHVMLDAEPDRDRFDVDVAAHSAAKGVLTGLTGLGKPLDLSVAGKGSWTRWDGRAEGQAAGAKLLSLGLTNRAGTYALSGEVDPATISSGRVRQLAGAVQVKGQAQLANRQLSGSVTARSTALAVDATGGLDLANNAFRDLRIRTQLLRPGALLSNMTGRGVELRAILDGPFATARFDYRLMAERMAFGDTGFQTVRAGGAGRLGTHPVKVPILFTAAQVTGVGDVAGGILRNLRVDGVLDVTGNTISGNKLKVRSDKLQAEVMLLVDLANGNYQVGVVGGLNRYLIPGLGIVDLTTDLRVVPGAGGKGTHIVGKAAAAVRRLDNKFFLSLTGGLPRLVTDLDQGPDGIFHFSHLVLTSPSLRLAGNGYRRRDGSFHFEGSGSQTKYGPLSLVLDGKIDKPTLDIKLAKPDMGAGLRDVTAHLDPTPQGFAFKASGQSMLGAFAGSGAILTPSGGATQVQIDGLDVGGAHAKGLLTLGDGGITGNIAVQGSGLTGNLTLAPMQGVQQIAGKVTAERAALQGISVRRGEATFTVLLDPAGTSVDATVSAQGVRQGNMVLSQVAANAKLRGGSGQVSASIAGARGRGFALQTLIQVSPNRFSVQAQGTVDNRPISLMAPAVITKEGGIWQLAPTQISFAGGQAQVGGRFGDGIAVEAGLTRMPLSVLDIALPGLGLGGSATGTLTYRDQGGAPTGRLDMTVRGMTRSGLVLSSTPIDVGVAALLEPGKASMRAVMASGGKTIGRAQALLSPLGSGGIQARLEHAPMIAQLRYAGPADTLWRLTGVELFDLSGPVEIGADMRGTIAKPSIQGSVRSTNAHIESAVTGTVLNNVQLNGRFDGSKLFVDQFAAKDGKNGTVTGTGNFDFAAPRGLGITLALQANNAAMINRDDIGATVTGPVHIDSNGNGGTISGDVQLTASRYQLGKAGAAAAAVPKLHVRELNRVTGVEEEEAAAGSPWTLDIHARAPGNLRVTGLGLNSEWSADLNIKGEPSNPRILGHADLIRGDLEFAGRDFELERGIIRFDGSSPANPSLDIAANADADNVSATIQVTGTANHTQISFTSVPALPQDELLSRLLFGTSITQLSAPEALQLASAVAALNSGTAGLDPINAVRRATGLDRLRIIPADPTTGQGTSIAAGKYVTRRTYVEIITDGQGYSATRAEFQVTRWLSLLATISTVGRQSATVRVSKDY